jgi:hypothetical protein
VLLYVSINALSNTVQPNIPAYPQLSFFFQPFNVASSVPVATVPPST